MSDLLHKIITIKDLLNIQNLCIPEYQRPYKWSNENVNQLIDDVIESAKENKSAYRIGTIVLHNDEGILNIVDGQQRVVTFMLIAYAILAERSSDIEVHHNSTIEQLYLPKSIISFKNSISKKNIVSNYQLVKRRAFDLSIAAINYFFKSCEVVYVQLDDITEAFQFFDSQNARGKDLNPHDLLKAYHLREMNNFFSEDEKREVTRKWESIPSNKLRKYFSEYLYRIRRWSNGYSAREFTKNDIGAFKGISPDIHENYPYAKVYRIACFYTEAYNDSVYKKINRDEYKYPFQIDQTIINGKVFFEMISYYSNIINAIEKKEGSFEKYKLLTQITEYDGANNTGDSYVLSMFRTALLYYFDKFGDESLETAIDTIFAWAYTLRLGLYSVGKDSIDNYALAKNGRVSPKTALFKKIKEAGTPRQFLAIDIPLINSNDKLFSYSKNRYQDSSDCERIGLKTLLKERHFYV